MIRPGNLFMPITPEPILLGTIMNDPGKEKQLP
jgi:hypothetical protein